MQVRSAEAMRLFAVLPYQVVMLSLHLTLHWHKQPPLWRPLRRAAGIGDDKQDFSDSVGRFLWIARRFAE